MAFGSSTRRRRPWTSEASGSQRSRIPCHHFVRPEAGSGSGAVFASGAVERGGGDAPGAGSGGSGSSASRLRRVTGKAASACNSTIPKVAGNLTSGGTSSVLTLSGKLAWLASVRPASSWSPAGTASVSSMFSGKGPSKATSSTKATRGSPGTVGWYFVPSASSSAIAPASARVIGALKFRDRGRNGMQPRSRLTRSQEKVARNSSRTSKASVWSSSVAMPVFAVTPLPHTSFTSAALGKRLWHCRTTMGESSPSTMARKRSGSASAPPSRPTVFKRNPGGNPAAPR